MSLDKKVDVTQAVTSRSFIPFTGGLIIFIYAFFWPEGYTGRGWG